MDLTPFLRVNPTWIIDPVKYETTELLEGNKVENWEDFGFASEFSDTQKGIVKFKPAEIQRLYL